ncbi:MAG: hypothetical protein ABUS54_01480 [Actinomycetota bacterium]
MSGVRMRGRTAAFAVAVVGLLLVSAPASSARTAGRHTLTIYSVATGLQYINTADDRARGKVNNPLDSSANRLLPKASSGRDGPFAGDVAVYALKLYSNATLKQSAGSAVYTCYFNYNRHALCQAYYTLKAGGTLVASGPIDFSASAFTIVVTGGTKKYIGARGEADVVPSSRNAQKIRFELLG